VVPAHVQPEGHPLIQLLLGSPEYSSRSPRSSETLPSWPRYLNDYQSSQLPTVRTVRRPRLWLSPATSSTPSPVHAPAGGRLRSTTDHPQTPTQGGPWSNDNLSNRRIVQKGLAAFQAVRTRLRKGTNIPERLRISLPLSARDIMNDSALRQWYRLCFGLALLPSRSFFILFPHIWRVAPNARHSLKASDERIPRRKIPVNRLGFYVMRNPIATASGLDLLYRQSMPT